LGLEHGAHLQQGGLHVRIIHAGCGLQSRFDLLVQALVYAGR
jgi:hypothetical protein